MRISHWCYVSMTFYKIMIFESICKVSKDRFTDFITINVSSRVTLVSMASAVTDSAAVLCFLTQKYQHSENCKAEFKYARKEEKSITV